MLAMRVWEEVVVGRVNFDQLEKACCRLGEAALDPAMWPEIMEEICRAAGAAGAVLLQSDVRTPDVPRTESVDEFIDNYFHEGWHDRDIRAARGVPLVLRGEPVVIDQDIISTEEMRRDIAYNECYIPNGYRWWAAVGFWSGSALWGLSIQRAPEEGPFDHKDKRILARLSPRLTEVATLATAVGRIALSSAINVLNAVQQPAIAIDRFGFVLDRNAAAEALFDQDLYVQERRLVVKDAQARGCLEQLIDRLLATPGSGTLLFEPIVIRRRGKASVIARTLPVHGAARTPFLGAQALLTFAAIERTRGMQPAMLARVFRLTPAEARLAAIIAEGFSPEGAAEKLGISTITARNQLKAIFAKTDTHRQGELIALLSRLG
jgi:DNA-binding CsgD family transcriptional regulator